MHDANDLAAKLRLALVEAGVTDAALAKACEVSPQAVTGWKRTGRIHKRHLAKISELTGKPVTWFIGGSALQLEGSARELMDEYQAMPGNLQQNLLAYAKSLRQLFVAENPATYKAEPAATAQPLEARMRKLIDEFTEQNKAAPPKPPPPKNVHSLQRQRNIHASRGPHTSQIGSRAKKRK